MDFKEFKLSALLEISKAINNKMAPKKLYLLLQFFLKNQLKIKRILLVGRDSSSLEVLMQHGVDWKHEDVSAQQLDNYQDIHYLNSLKHNPFPEFEVLVPIFHHFEPKAYLLLGDIEQPDKFKVSPVIKNLRFIQTLANLIVVATENQKLVEEQIEKERLQRELELASEIQNLLIPKKLPSTKEVSAYAIYQPHDSVGGDYYDMLYLGDKRYFFCIADISGKGVSAALIMANFQAYVRSNVISQENLSSFYQALNSAIFNLTKGEAFITFFGGIYDATSNELQYINAAHFAQFLHTEKGTEQLPSFMPGLGMTESPEIKDARNIQLPDHSCLVCYTDGVTEIEHKPGQYIGTDGLEKMVDAHCTFGAKETVEAIYNGVKKFSEGSVYDDDFTLFAICFNSGG